MRWLTLAVLTILACSPESAPGRPPVPAADYERALEEIGLLRERIAELEAREVAPVAECPPVPQDVEELREGHFTLSQEAATARSRAELLAAELDQHREGLARCVAELNELGARKTIVVGQGAPGPSYVAPSAPRPAPRAGPVGAVVPRPAPAPRRLRPVRTLSAPQVQVVGEDVLVSARLWNPEEVERHVTVEFSVLVDGSVRDTESQSQLIPAAGDLAVSHRFHAYPSWVEGRTLTGRVRVLE